MLRFYLYAYTGHVQETLPYRIWGTVCTHSISLADFPTRLSGAAFSLRWYSRLPASLSNPAVVRPNQASTIPSHEFVPAEARKAFPTVGFLLLLPFLLCGNGIHLEEYILRDSTSPTAGSPARLCFDVHALRWRTINPKEWQSFRSDLPQQYLPGTPGRSGNNPPIPRIL